MKRTECLKRTGLTEGKHLFKVANIKPLEYDASIPVEERIPKMIISGVVFINGQTNNGVVHNVYALNTHECIDGQSTSSMYDEMVFAIFDMLGITEDIDTENIPDVLSAVRGKTFPCYIIKNLYEKDGIAKEYYNVLFTKTTQVEQMLKIQELLNKR